MKSKNWLVGWLVLVFMCLVIIGWYVYRVDPYFHYHKPYTDYYYYLLDNQRSQNNGIVKHFDYDALITGTSMTENFKTSELDEIFGVSSIKVSYAGGSYKEINDNLLVALKNNQNIKFIFRSLDADYFLYSSNFMRDDLGTYPTYLYDENPFNDVKYLFNKDVIFERVFNMELKNDKEDFISGITSFDDYRAWQDFATFGINSVTPDRIVTKQASEPISLTDMERNRIKENIDLNVTSIADKYPNVTFYYFFTPYSALWWKDYVDNGEIYRNIEAEEYIIELILEHKNILLFSFNNRTDITTDLNNYKDKRHFAQWVNSLMLKYMCVGKYQLTIDNYRQYLSQELEFYTSFDYGSLNEQTDYGEDYYAAALMNEEIHNVAPVDILSVYKDSMELSDAQIVDEQFDIIRGLLCSGSLMREVGGVTSISDYLFNTQYIGAKICIDVGKYNYLVFNGKKISGNGQPTVCVYDNKNEVIDEISVVYSDIDSEWNQYLLDLSNADGEITIIFNGGYIDSSGSMDSSYIFSNIILY